MSTLTARIEPDAPAHAGPPICHRTRTFRAVGFAFVIEVNDADLGGLLDQAWAPLAVDAAPAHHYRIVDRGAGAFRRFWLDFDGRRVTETDRPSNALHMLCWHVNGQVVAHRGDHLVVHAAAAEHEGRAVLIPATMGSGKTTLVAGLTAAGLRYLTDEAAAVDPAATVVQPYAKPLSVDPGSWEVLASLRPSLPARLEAYLTTQWQVPATSIRADAVGSACTPRWIVATGYQPGVRTALEPMTASDAVITVARNSFHFTDDPGRHLAIAAALVARCHCYRLVVSDLDEACELVLNLVQEP